MVLSILPQGCKAEIFLIMVFIVLLYIIEAKPSFIYGLPLSILLIFLKISTIFPIFQDHFFKIKEGKV